MKWRGTSFQKEVQSLGREAIDTEWLNWGYLNEGSALLIWLYSGRFWEEEYFWIRMQTPHDFWQEDTINDLPHQWHQMVIELLIKKMKNGISLIYNIQEIKICILGIWRRNT